MALGASVVSNTIERSLEELEREPRFLRMQLWDYLERTDDMSELIVTFTDGFAKVVSRVQEAGHPM